MAREASIAEELIQCVEGVGIVHILDELEWYDIVLLYVKACESIGREPKRVEKGLIPRSALDSRLRENLRRLGLMEDDDPERRGLLDEDDDRLNDL